MSGEFQKFDFKKPSGLSNDSLELTRVWFKNWTSIFKEKWTQIGNTAPGFEFDSDAAHSFEVLRKQFASPSVAFQLRIPSQNLDSILVFQRIDALNICFDMLGEESSETIDRELSDIEFSLFNLFTTELLNSFSEAWPMKEKLTVELGDRVHQVHRSRLFDPKLIMLNVKFRLSREGAEDTAFHLLVPQKDFENFLMQSASEISAAQQSAATQLMENKALEIEVNLSVILGDAVIKLADLNQLQAGDVVRFGQKIDEPLEVTVEDRPKFRVWPGVLNQQQAVVVSQVL